MVFEQKDSASYIPGAEDSADFYSRNFTEFTKWMLKQDIFDRFCWHFFKLEIDLFASRLNTRLEQFIS